MSDRAPKVEWLDIVGDADIWRSLGLAVTADGTIPLMGTSLRIVAAPAEASAPSGEGSAPGAADADGPAGIVGWALSGLGLPNSAVSVSESGTDVTEISRASSIDGLATETIEPAPPVFADHALGASGLDHVVVLTPDLERTSAAIAEATGCDLKRIREVGSMRQGFHRIGRGGLIVELVERPDLPQGPAEFWGLVLIVDDLDRACDVIGADRISVPKDAVQPGRRIATVRSDVGLGLPLALMTN